MSHRFEARGEQQTIEPVVDMEQLRQVGDLFTQVWGRNPDGVPMPGEMLRSLVHAGGLVSAARSEDVLVGAAVLGRSLPGECYSYLAAVRPGYADRGIGRALKLHQREWALDAGLRTMEWTFDPLGARNARFNLVKLGAVVREYEIAFYGAMHDSQNAGEIGDRLVARWELDTDRVRAAISGSGSEPPGPSGAVLATGPDEAPFAWLDGEHRWVRVPRDIVALRSQDRAAAKAWRLSVRDAFTAALGDGWLADGLTREGCYHFSRDSSGQDER
ncbi:MAG: GNAT family N-acetyltransferase [Intrasporangium sp.]|uniref:GNAT family N-acetyltransferase n=1 Tax=Intrasporangium sp. TaxID=1925024 RepID=UPI00264A2373|nr:GNAT family N-acetyltransferase [Intrasporangium sp.]MDN5796324.1 GNAT family N-acetyltransferase [Intrasporangium sp.]